MKKIVVISVILVLITFLSCKDKIDAKTDNEKEEKVEVQLSPRVTPKEVAFQMLPSKDWLAANKDNGEKMNLVLAANRTDAKHISKMDSILVPTDFSGDIAYYLPFPLEVPALQEVDKIIFFSYPSQTFATYEKGALIHTGPTNMGSKAHQTETISTFDDEWKLKWNFNVENLEGIGWHEYDLPGYPASHSCMRLQEKDAKILYDWADQWVLADKETVKVKGTPTVIFGSYNFDEPKPWLQLVSNPKALTITAAAIEKIISPYMSEIMDAQQVRNSQKEVVSK
jgi:hypothetical protein